MGRMSALFSFLIANYNNRQFAPDLLDSLLAQTFNNWEAIIIDDASPDGGIADIVDACHDRRIKYTRLEQNAGAAHAWNLAFGMSNGTHYPIIGADDMITSDYLEKMRTGFASDENPSVIYVDLEYFGSVSGVSSLPEHPPGDLAISQWLPHGGACVTREVMEKSGGYYEGPELRHGNIDWDFWLSVAENGPFRIKHIAEPLYRYRQHPGNMTKKRGRFEYVTRECMYRRHRKFFDSYMCGDTFLATGYYKSAAAAWQAGDYARAIVFSKKAAEFVPPRLPGMWQQDLSIQQLARLVATTENELAIAGADSLEPNWANLEKRMLLVRAYISLRQWPEAKKNILELLATALGLGDRNIAASAAGQLALIFERDGEIDLAEDAARFALINDPLELAGLDILFARYVARKEYNAAIRLFLPWLKVKDMHTLARLAPCWERLARLPDKETAWAVQRLTELANMPATEKHEKSFEEKLYSTQLGRRVYWEFRAGDLYRRYGHNTGGQKALLEALKISNARNVLEVGCGNGRNLAFFSTFGLECVGQDISAAALRLAAQRKLPGVRLVCGKLQDMEFGNDNFDLIVCNRVLQHVGEQEIAAILDTIVSRGHYIYVNECQPGDGNRESWYLKQYDLTSMLEKRGMHLVGEISDNEAEHAMIFGKSSNRQV